MHFVSGPVSRVTGTITQKSNPQSGARALQCLPKTPPLREPPGRLAIERKAISHVQPSSEDLEAVELAQMELLESLDDEDQAAVEYLIPLGIGASTVPGLRDPRHGPTFRLSVPWKVDDPFPRR